MASRRKPRSSAMEQDLPAGTALVLDAQCTLRECIALKGNLAEALALGGAVQLDGGSVQRIDTAGLQLLLAMQRQLQAEHRDLQWTRVSRELRDVAQQLGLDATLALPTEVAA
jgi:ABC-type transporter Mla MlaB component